MDQLNINPRDYFMEALNFLIGKIPVIGAIHEVHGKALRNAEIDRLRSKVEKIENLEFFIKQLSSDLNSSPATSYTKSGAIELESIRQNETYSGVSSNDRSNPIATSNQYIKNLRTISPVDNFFFELKMRDLTDQFEKKKGISLIFTDQSSKEIIPEFLHLIILEDQAFFTHSTKLSSQELGWAEIPIYETNTFKMGRRNGLLSCSINGVNIFTDKIIFKNNLQPGIFIDKDITVKWNLIFSFFKS